MFLEPRPIHVPVHHAALLVPVAEDDAMHWPFAHVERLDGRAVGMAVQQHVDAVILGSSARLRPG